MELATLLSYVIVVFLPVLLYKYLKWHYEYVRIIDKIPGPRSYPLIGNLLDVMFIQNEELIKYDYEAHQKYGPIKRTWLGPTPIVEIGGGDLHEAIFTGTKHLEKPPFYNLLHKWLGKGLLTSSGAQWQAHRKMITPTFHFKILENFHEVMVEKTQILINNLAKEATKGQVFNIFPFITNATLDIICETAMGINLDVQRNEPSDYIKAITWYLGQITYRMNRPWLLSDTIYYMTSMGKTSIEALKELHGFTDMVIRQKKVARKATRANPEPAEDVDHTLGKKKKIAFLDMLLDVADYDPRLTDESIRNEVDTFMFGGHDTTTASISWALFLLGWHPEIQEAVYNEICQVLNGEDRPVSFNDASELKYLERVIKESLRLYPSVLGYGRKTEEDIVCGGYTIPKDTVVVLNLYPLHRDPKHFPDPHRFDPDNFLPERTKSRHPLAFLPFSAGPRNCIGQKYALLEEKTILSSILRKFRVRSIEKPEEVIMLPEVILRPKSGIKVFLEARDKKT